MKYATIWVGIFGEYQRLLANARANIKNNVPRPKDLINKPVIVDS